MVQLTLRDKNKRIRKGILKIFLFMTIGTLTSLIVPIGILHDYSFRGMRFQLGLILFYFIFCAIWWLMVPSYQKSKSSFLKK